MAVRHFLSIGDAGTELIVRLVQDAVAIARGEWEEKRSLDHRYVGMAFGADAMRARTAFSVGAMRLGASTVPYGLHDLRPATGETLADLGRVLSEHLDVLVVRSHEPASQLADLAAQNRMSVVNAMSDSESPVQALADLATIHETFGRIDGIHVLYLGEGNTTVSAQALAFSQVPGMKLSIVSPKGRGIPVAVLEKAHRNAHRCGATVQEHHRMDRLPHHVDVVYTSRWAPLGELGLEDDWVTKARPYAVTAQVMAEVSRAANANGPGTIFLHDQPAMRGFEVTDEVLDSPSARPFRLAHHLMTSAMAVFSWCCEGPASIVPGVRPASMIPAAQQGSMTPEPRSLSWVPES